LNLPPSPYFTLIIKSPLNCEGREAESCEKAACSEAWTTSQTSLSVAALRPHLGSTPGRFRELLQRQGKESNIRMLSHFNMFLKGISYITALLIISSNPTFPSVCSSFHVCATQTLNLSVDIPRSSISPRSCHARLSRAKTHLLTK
jgi:hypothetical protein